MRRAITPAIPPKMYRHFAIVTVLLTAGVAMFADGENRQAEAVAVARPGPAEPNPTAALATEATANASSRTPRWWNVEPEPDDSSGKPIGRLLGSEVSGIARFDQTLVPGYSPEYLASLSEEERELLLRGLQENGMLEPEIHDQRTAALTAASARRSGAASGGD